MRGLLASPLGLLIGLSLGALGGGGSILAVPALVYGAGEPAQAATSTSLLVVGVASLLGLGTHWRAGHVQVRPGLVFGATGIGGNAVGTALNDRVDADVLLLAFSSVMVVAAIGMARSRGAAESKGQGEEAHRRRSPDEGAVAIEAPARASLSLRSSWPKLVLAGTVVGLMTGFFGVGGGFVIVPALVLTLGFSMPDAVGTSLVVIAINSAIALGLRTGSLDVRWGDALPFLVLAVIGTLIGQRVAERLPAQRLTGWFVALLLLVATYTAVSSVGALV